MTPHAIPSRAFPRQTSVRINLKNKFNQGILITMSLLPAKIIYLLTTKVLGTQTHPIHFSQYAIPASPNYNPKIAH